jgi:sugar O-acyltransferase (sialic acid O-acetyltransferase NeuD family)
MNYILYGASGHAKVIESVIQALDFKIDYIFEDQINTSKIWGKYETSNCYDASIFKNDELIIAIGNNRIRKKISKHILHKFGTLIHPSSILDNQTCIGHGSVILHSTIIQRDAIIGKHCIINTNASIDHDCIIQDFVHISPSATLCGNVLVDEGTHIGAGATINPNINIGKWCVIGSGAVIIRNIPDYSIVVGIPGKIIKTLKDD